MAGDSDPTRVLDKLLGLCVAVLLGCMALYGAIEILKAIWVPLCLLAFVLVVGFGLWAWMRRTRGW